ncbi:pyroglutamyl-peptidase I family protein [Xanthobacter sediminis]
MDRRTRILVCAFGPFPGVPVNPSARLALKLARTRRPALADIDLRVEILPTRWDALGELARHLDGFKPDAVLLLGVAPRRRALCVETRAVNAAADHPDAARRHPGARRIDPQAPLVLRTRAHVPPLVAAARSAFASTRPSRDAGRYLCNASYFTALAWAKGIPVVFVHVPGRPRRPRGESHPGIARALAALLRNLAAQARHARHNR